MSQCAEPCIVHHGGGGDGVADGKGHVLSLDGWRRSCHRQVSCHPRHRTNVCRSGFWQALRSPAADLRRAFGRAAKASSLWGDTVKTAFAPSAYQTKPAPRRGTRVVKVTGFDAYRQYSLSRVGRPAKAPVPVGSGRGSFMNVRGVA